MRFMSSPFGRACAWTLIGSSSRLCICPWCHRYFLAQRCRTRRRPRHRRFAGTRDLEQCRAGRRSLDLSNGRADRRSRSPILGLLAAMAVRELRLRRLVLAPRPDASLHPRRQHGSRIGPFSSASSASRPRFSRSRLFKCFGRCPLRRLSFSPSWRPSIRSILKPRTCTAPTGGEHSAMLNCHSFLPASSVLALSR